MPVCAHWPRSRPLFADAETGKDFSQQIVSADRSQYFPEGFLRQAQFLGEELPPSYLQGGGVQMNTRRTERAQMPLARKEHRFAS